MAGLNGRDTTAQQPVANEQIPATGGYENLILKSFGIEPEQWREGLRETMLWTLMLLSGCRPFLSENAQQFDREPQRAVATAPLNPGANASIEEPHHSAHLHQQEQAVASRDSSSDIHDTTTVPGYDTARVALIERYESLMVNELHDGLALELMMLPKAQADELRDRFPAEDYPYEETRIQLLCDYAVQRGYVQADVAESAYHSYLFIKARALCTDMLEVQLSGFQSNLSHRELPTASLMTARSEDPIHDALRFLNTMSEAILLKANEHGPQAQQAASSTHPGTVMARDLARILVDPQLNNSHTRGDLEQMARVTLDTYCQVTGDTAVIEPYTQVIRDALDVALVRRAGIIAQQLQHDTTTIVTAAKESNILVYFDINGDGTISRTELSPLGQRYNAELIEALEGLAAPTSTHPVSHGGEH